ncbi:MAG TPA: single-stranded DNA-binding protein [Microbacterium sp.]|uniref:single-stranded DNA-binding protein n=1 Tax=Microbacterium sp. TaxID=51671 RepID=UPI002B48C5C3|nr:single-stranded DNA-binding protein [Microbacterium sp.]HKT55548.1 single-stranded DNA-binding protein [Microbacterium sp.]
MSDTITVTGNITEPELRHLPSGVAVLSFKVGSSHRMLDKTQNKWVETGTSWYAVSAFRGLADHGFASLHRGDRVVVHGRIKLREWENGSGSKGFSAEIEADSIGHDLLFGTTTFVKAVAGAPEAWAASGGEPDDAARPVAADGGDAAGAPDARGGAASVPELALAGSGASGETPF